MAHRPANEHEFPEEGGARCQDGSLVRSEVVRYPCLSPKRTPRMGSRERRGASLPMKPPFTTVDLEQGTREWLEWRHNGIGASDASTIMGQNRFSSAAALLKEKRDPVRDSFQNEAMALGRRLEPEARKRYIAETGKDVRPVCLQSTRYDWLRASLDGLTVDHDAVVEIKCGRSAYWSTARSGSVPTYYYGQLQHIMAITGLDSLDFWCYWPDNPEILLPVERDDDYIEVLLSKELKFWNDVQRDG